MPKGRAKNIRLDELSVHVKKAVENALAAQSTIKREDIEFGFTPEPGILGYILNENALDRVKAADLSAFAKAVTTNLGDFAGDANPVALVHDGGATMGYFPR